MAKIKVTNMSREPVNFLTGIKDGEPVTDHLEPNEAKEIELDTDSAHVRGMILAGLITVPKSAERAAAKPVAPAA